MFPSCKLFNRFGEYIVSENKLSFPSTYSEIFEILYKNNWIDKDALKSFKRLIFLRNLIAHEYYKIDEDILKEMIELCNKVKPFIEKVKSEML